MYRKEIMYDRATRDYAMYLDGELVGFARTYHEGEITLDALVFQLLTDLAPAALSPQVTADQAAEGGSHDHAASC